MGTLRTLVGIVLGAVFVALGVYGLYLTEIALWSAAGWIGIIFGNLLFPVAFALAPFYELLAHGDWTLLGIWAVGLLLPLLRAIDNRVSAHTSSWQASESLERITKLGSTEE